MPIPIIGKLVWVMPFIRQWPMPTLVCPSPGVAADASSSHAPNCLKLETDVKSSGDAPRVSPAVATGAVVVVDVSDDPPDGDGDVGAGAGEGDDGAGDGDDAGLSALGALGLPFPLPLPCARPVAGVTSHRPATISAKRAKGRTRRVIGVSLTASPTRWSWSWCHPPPAWSCQWSAWWSRGRVVVPVVGVVVPVVGVVVPVVGVVVPGAGVTVGGMALTVLAACPRLMPSTVIAFCRSANGRPRFFETFSAAMN